jgi:hypothetical protein
LVVKSTFSIRAAEDKRGAFAKASGSTKKQGHRRSIPPTTLPAPDIEIGSRHPVNYTLPRLRSGKCDPFHNRREKVADGSFWEEGWLCGKPHDGVRKPTLPSS